MNLTTESRNETFTHEEAVRRYSEGLWPDFPTSALAAVLAEVNEQHDRAERRVPHLKRGQRETPSFTAEHDHRSYVVWIWSDLRGLLLGELERKAGRS